MLMSYIIAAMFAVSVIFGAYNGKMAEVSSAFVSGAGTAVELCIKMGGAVCLWSGIMQLMKNCGISEALARWLRPLLSKIYPNAFSDNECAAAITENFAANLLGLGNAATPAGIKAAVRMKEVLGETSREIGRLVVMNSASIQLIPATVASIRAAGGASDPFDIIVCVWLTSICSVAVGLLISFLPGKSK